ncbi:MAG: hypothetical protein ACO3F2_04230 [Roseiflexaceae bacterium]
MLADYLLIINRIVTNITLVVSFSLWAYLIIRSRGIAVSRALMVLLFGVVTTVTADVLVRQAKDSFILEIILRGSWFGIMLVPAGMIDMVLALAAQLRVLPKRTWVIVANYAVVVVVTVIAVSTDWLISMPLRSVLVPTLSPQPLFAVIAVYAFALVTVAWIILWRVRAAALTPSLRRRLGYMIVGWYGAILLSFPVLSLLPSAYMLPEQIGLGLATLAAPVAAIFMMVTVYSAMFVGSSQPDRIIKHDFLRWWLYGPFVGISIVLFLQTVPVFARLSRLPEETWAVFGIMTMTVIMPMLVGLIRPYLDVLVYAGDEEEMASLRSLPRNTFTQNDLRRLLENSLTVICGAVRSDSAFVAAPDEFGGYAVKMSVGPRRRLRKLFEQLPLERLFYEVGVHDHTHLQQIHEYTLYQLKDPDQRLVGILGISNQPKGLTDEVQQLIYTLTNQIEHALVMVLMQQRLLDTLRTMGPEMSTLRQLSSRIEQATPEALQSLEDDVALMPEFTHLVRDALNHYWGGPKLSDSPLLGLKSVKTHIDLQGGSSTKALQAVLRQAIDNLRPDDSLPSTANEWMLYNILEMRFLQGRKIRDTAQRLALSESDLYRKQRVAIDEVARQLTLMEEYADKSS